MEIDVLIIGQGICGTFLSREMDRLGLSYLVIDDPRPYTASKAAAGIINPITGKRLVKTWIIDELLPFAVQAYREAGAALGISCITQTHIIDFFPHPDARLTFHDRYAENQEYLQLPADEGDLSTIFNYDFGYGLVSPCYLTDLSGLMAAVRADLKGRGRLLEEKWVQEELVLEGGGVRDDGRRDAPGVRYRDIRAGRLIFCDGIESFHRPWFNLLPFSPNKGEALIAEIPGLPPHTLFKRGLNLVPLKDGLYWIGSSYEWSFKEEGPTEVFRNRTEGLLRNWLKLPFKTVDHIAAIRPATLERRPFVGFHPLHPAIGILNGMGTKGCSLAPYFARQLAEHLAYGTEILPEADVRRFTRVLSRGTTGEPKT
jgi:glycine/D-amino acid oxidase-like deaminating enzyme